MNAKEQVQDLLNFIDASPSPWHAVATLEQRLQQFDFVRLHEAEQWSLVPGGRYYVIRDGSSIIAFVAGSKPLSDTGFKILGAHTDSPGLRVKPNAIGLLDGVIRVGVEVYGGPILATFTDRDLSLAGRVSYKADDGAIASRLCRFDQPLLRLPNLAIHMNRNVNDEGLKLNKQLELPLLLTTFAEEQLPPAYFYQLLQQATAIDKERVLSWELQVYDTQKGVFWGPSEEFFADSQLDNLASCHAGLSALLDENSLNAEATSVCAFFDHEEIGSESHKGADGCFLPDVLERMSRAVGEDRDGYQRALARSFMISADMAHAYQPNFPNAYEPDHKVMINRGPVIKVNANQRYTSESLSEAMFMEWCRQAEVGWQQYSHRTDIACGSTIGPMLSARLGVRTVDIGNPMWAMHSARESAGVYDHIDLIKVLRCFFAG
ncbi:M18 family aminopeptidase [Methylomarinum vadi]|uniref:M18 family aminopeptidase n=1 Tax=Methylomarinum vadi TaxID=438855 RepID=UPI0004DFC427|nr:M18 family aminopeptidase [Methylomarinum vadi]